MLCFCIPAVELDHGFTVGPVIAVVVGDKEQVRRGADPYSAEAQLDPGEVGPLVVKDCPAIELSVVVGVFENQDSVLASRASQPDRVGVVFDDPEPPSVIDGHGDRLDDVGLGGEQANRKPLGQRDPPHRLARKGEHLSGSGVPRGAHRSRSGQDRMPSGQAPRPSSIRSDRQNCLATSSCSTAPRQDEPKASALVCDS